MSTRPCPRFLVYGGDERFASLRFAGVEVRALGSSRHNGNGSLRRAVATIRAQATDVVLLLIKWIGHADNAVITEACRAAGVPLRIVWGGVSALRRELAVCVPMVRP
jgi:hypothetical protein